MTFSPHVAEEFRGAFYGINRGKVFEGQYRNHEVAGQRPGDADDPHDNAAENAEAFFQSAQNDAEGCGHERPLENRGFALPSQLDAVAKQAVVCGRGRRDSFR